MNEFSERISVWVKVGPNQTTGGGELSPCEMLSKRPGQTCRFLGGYELTLAAAQETKKPEPHSFQMSPG